MLVFKFIIGRIGILHFHGRKYNARRQISRSPVLTDLISLNDTTADISVQKDSAVSILIDAVIHQIDVAAVRHDTDRLVSGIRYLIIPNQTNLGIQHINPLPETAVQPESTDPHNLHIFQEKSICSHIIAAGTVDELKAQVKAGETISVELPELPDGLAQKLKAMPRCLQVAYKDHTLTVRCANGPHNLLDVLGVVRDCHGVPGRVWSQPPTLNDVFLELTGRELRD